MSIEPKSIPRTAIQRSLAKADRYRLLNEPFSAESICLDILAIDPDNRDARLALVLSLSDQFLHGREGIEARARAEIERLSSEYERSYYTGIILERRGYAALQRGSHGVETIAYRCITEAMLAFEKAASLAEQDNADATLRWNSCARLLARYRLTAPTDEHRDDSLE
jgi:hypothetical protein